jgi:hypothetical protein
MRSDGQTARLAASIEFVCVIFHPGSLCQVYLYMTWLPNYLQTARGLSLCTGVSIFKSPCLAAS